MEATGVRSYNIVVRNRPGELARLTKFLLDRRVTVEGLAVANAGRVTAIRFTTARSNALDGGLRRSGFFAA